MAIQKFLNLEGLSVFLDNLRSTFSPSKHTHTKSEITDLTVDSSLSATSTNPVQNSTVTAALDAKVPTTRTINGKSLSSNISLSPADVGADPTGTASSAVATHNTTTDAHNDIRLLVSELSTQLNNFLNVDDTTKDQLSEVIAMIEANEGTIESLTSGKVNVTDIINNLTTNVSDKPLSAAQGVALKALIDELRAALETVHVQADLSVNDETDPRYVHGRTHWIGDPVETVLIPEQTVSFKVSDEMGQALSPVTVDLVEGQSYTVNFDGVTYECVCKMFDIAYLYIGSSIAFGLEDTGEPFTYICVGGQSMWGAYNAETEHTLSLSTVVSEIVKIPKKFLPDYDFAGKNVSGKTIMGHDGNEYVGNLCAEIFNDLTNKASGQYSHAEGMKTTASGNNSHAEGYRTTASGYASHAEGVGTTASYDPSHAEGYHTTASGFASHAEGGDTVASGDRSHAEGMETTASGNYSHAEGYWTNAVSSCQHVQGKYNINDTNNQYAHIVGNGTSATALSNAHTLDWEGNAWFAGKVYVGGTGQDDEAAVEVATKNEIIPRPSTATVGQTIVVKSVDENGVPTKWETADMPERAQSYTATIGTSWTEDTATGAKYQTVSISGVTADMTAKVDTINTHDRTSDGYALYVEEQNQFLEFITNGDAETVDGGVKFYIYGEANAVEIPIVVEVG